MAVGVWKPFQKGREKLEVPYGCQEGSRCLPRGLGGEGGPPGEKEGVRRHFWRARMSWEGRERSGGPRERDWRNCEALPDGRERLGGPLERGGRS